MRRPVVSLLGLVLLIGLRAAPAATAQTARSDSAPAASGPAKTPETKIVEEKEIFYLRDKDGRLRKVFGFTYEELMELVRGASEPVQRGPAATLEEIVAQGTADREQVELTVTAAIALRRDGWHRVPLGFPGAVLRESAEHEGGGEHVLAVDPADGFVSWINGKAGTQHKITMQLRAPLSTKGERWTLRLAAAAGAVQSQLQIRVPVKSAKASVEGGALLLESKPAGDNATEVTVAGLGPKFAMSWHAPDQMQPKPPMLFSEVTMSVTVDGHSVRTETNLLVRGRGGPVPSFEVRLPPGAELQASESADFSIAETQRGDDHFALITRSGSASGPVQLVTVRRRDVKQPKEVIELAGFEVSGATDGRGRMDVFVAGDLRVIWKRRDAVGEAEPPNEPAADDVRHVASLDVYQYPYSAAITIAPQRTRVAVKADYHVTVFRDRAELLATLQYRIRGAPASEFRLSAPGWEIDDARAESPHLVDLASDLIADDGEVDLPLVQATRGDVKIVVTAHRRIDPNDQAVQLPIPQALSDTVGSATVTIQPADDVVLSPKSDEITGLMRDTRRPGESSWQQPALLFRSALSNAIPRFVAGFQVQSGIVEVDVQTAIGADEQYGRVEQTFDYRIAHQKVSRLALAVPAVLAEATELTILVDGKPATMRTRPGEEGGRTAPGHERQVIVLAEPRIGHSRVTVAYAWPIRRWPDAGQAELNLPLVMPADATTVSNRLLLRPNQPAAEITLSDPSWTRSISPGPDANDPTAVFRRDGPADVVRLRISRPTRRVVVQRSWVQTWVIGRRRHVRAVYRIGGTERQLRIAMPEDVSIEGEPQAWLDGGIVDLPPVASDRILSVQLSPPGTRTSADSQHTLEIIYVTAPDAAQHGVVELTAPRLLDAAGIGETLWQVVVTPGNHVIDQSSSFTPEMTWDWNGWFWQRVPNRSQSQLQQFAGVTPLGAIEREKGQREKGPDAANRYLYSSPAGEDRLTILVASRSELLLYGGGVVLGFSLMLLYFPKARHPVLLLLAAAALLFLSAVYPEPALLFGQAAAIGVALALLALLLRWTVREYQPERSTARSRTSSIVRQALPEAPRAGSSHATTQSAPADAGAYPVDSTT